MPLVLAGTCLAALSLLVQRRRQWLSPCRGCDDCRYPPVSLWPWRQRQRIKIILFDFLEFLPIYHDLAGVGLHPAVGLSCRGVQDLSAHSLASWHPAAGALGCEYRPTGPVRLARVPSVSKGPCRLVYGGFRRRGWIVYLVLAHPAYSQAYFLRLANPMASVFGVWVLAAAVQPRCALAAALPWLWRWRADRWLCCCLRTCRLAISVGHANDLAAVVVSILVPIGLVCVALAVGVLAWVLARRRVPGLRGWGTVLVLAAFVVGGPAEACCTITTAIASLWLPALRTRRREASSQSDILILPVPQLSWPGSTHTFERRRGRNQPALRLRAGTTRLLLCCVLGERTGWSAHSPRGMGIYQCSQGADRPYAFSRAARC